jgi:hypothetical protein
MPLTLTAVEGRSIVDEPALTGHSPDQTKTRQEQPSLPSCAPRHPYSRLARPPTARHHPARARRRDGPRQLRRDPSIGPASCRPYLLRPTVPVPGTPWFRATPNSPARTVSDGPENKPEGETAARAGPRRSVRSCPLHRSRAHQRPRSLAVVGAYALPRRSPDRTRTTAGTSRDVLC